MLKCKENENKGKYNEETRNFPLVKSYFLHFK